MNYVEKFDSSHFSADSAVVSGVDLYAKDGIASHAPSGHGIIVPDAHLLFTGDFKRAGSDLVLSKDGHDHVVHDYFKGHARATLSSPDGAQLSGALVEALTGEVQVAQAGGGGGAATVIGHVTKLTGSATAIRNGVSVLLNAGDNVNKGDVVQAGTDSSLGLTFIDGTVFGLSSNARMVLNEMVYDPNGSSNSSLLSLVQGTITFVAGETAKHGDMKVDTPVATMGIRGTAVLVEIDFSVPGQGGAPPVKFQVLVEPGGHTGSYVLYSKTGAIIGTVNQSGQVTLVDGAGDATTTPAPPLSQTASDIIAYTLQQYFPNYVPNANPKGSGSGSGSTPPFSNPDPLKLYQPPDMSPGVPFIVPINLPDGQGGSTHVDVTVTRFNSAPTVTVTPIVVTLPVNKNSFDIPQQPVITDPDPGDVIVPYVPGSGHLISASGPANGPSSAVLGQFITIDAQTGHVSYNPDSFKFLGEGQSAVFTIGFDVQSGPDTLHETLTFTVDGVNDAPVVTSATLNLSEGDVVVLTPADIVVNDPDSSNFTFKVSNVTHGMFQTTSDGIHWYNATTFTTADLKAGHVRFMSDGGGIAPTFSIQADDGASTSHASEVVAGTSNFTAVNDAPTLTSATLSVENGGIVVLDASSLHITHNEALVDFSVYDPPSSFGAVFATLGNSSGFRPSVSIVINDPDSSSFRFIVSNVTHGTFQTTSDGIHWVDATTFTSDDINASHVRFVQDGSYGIPTFSIQVDDGGSVNNLSNVATGQSSLHVVDHAPAITATSDGFAERAGTGIQCADVASGTITFTDADIDDRPKVSASFSSFTLKDAGGHDISGSLTDAQRAAIQSVEAALALTPANGNGHNGSVGWTYSVADYKFDFLSAGETLTLTYMAQVDDGFSGGAVITNVNGITGDGVSIISDSVGGSTAATPITITITGTNDAPVVAAALAADAHEGDAVFTKDLLAGATDVDDGETATLALTNVTYSVNGATASGTAPAGFSLSGATLSVDPTNAAFDHLAEGQTETIVVSYDVTDVHGAIVHQTETVTITGTNDVPVIVPGETAASKSIAVSAATSTVRTSGTITFADPDVGDIHSILSVTYTGVGTALGALVFTLADTTSTDPEGQFTWTYTAASAAAVQAALLDSAAGTKVETFDVTISDGHGGTVVQTVSVTLSEANAAVWVGDTGGNWNLASNWSPAGVPTASTIAYFDTTTTVNLTGDVTIAGLHVAQGDLVHVTTTGGGHVLDVTGSLLNDGTIQLGSGATLELNGVVQNSGNIIVDVENYHPVGATLLIDGHVSLEGHGTVTLDGVSDAITGHFSFYHPAILENVDNTINGYGQLGAGYLNLINDSAGKIIASNASHGIDIDTGFGSFVNHGLVASYAAGGLEIEGDVYNDGMLEAKAGLLDVDGKVTGHGHAIVDGGTLEFGDDSDASVEFAAGTHGTLVLDDPDDFTGTISGYVAGDSIQTGYGAAKSVTSAGDDYSKVFHYAHGPDLIVANSNATTLTHVLNGNTNDDIYIGSSAADNFVFAAHLGDDIITNFQHGVDHIDLSTVVTTNNLSAWIAQHVTQSPTDWSDTLIRIDSHDTITLHNVLASSLTASDFIVHSGSGPHIA